ncbi:DNA double-strand break repair ATPase Rad50 [Natronobacterium gregoryi]|uniref:DNA double-strand break repair Rad50 ATPase n=2 Tax=Natronobacterium gregoryi TaxID=44930 RepID=L0AEF6_NATGS|nr:DNA double-strand break repair ATPase Rad50 [Natronobacterium gregoryi]AFZ71814.1 ATPase involved in DNA repair [Natronobacterium gregoryi SP2]ELY72955.1 chromosome segregation protein [Natronobacterium gregoryi SP2]PLK21005.1 chromosome segregation protein [Natronobacterium gregoryi SP2]SFI87219.1 exonuclease SbcC [Natronobacterium gregoryi]
MRVDRVRLLNFKCYGDADLTLERGVTVVHGVNGSGKSTLLEAVFFALYGSKALDSRTLDDVITTGEKEAEVELWFTHDDRKYHVERQLKLRGDRATTTKCVLETPTESIEGARDVRREVTELLRMDAEAFVNCAYVRQGEVNKLIHASPSDRQDMIDDLLQLGALEEYRERASDARLGVKSVLDGQREVLEDVRKQVEKKEEANLHERLNDLESRRAEITENIDHFESQREEAQETLETAEDVLERHAETREEIDDLEAEVEAIRSKVEETERKREDAKERIRELEAEREELAEERAELLEEAAVDVEDDRPETVESAIEGLESRDEQLRDDLEEVKIAIQTKTDERERLQKAADDLEKQAEAARERADELTERLEEDEEAIEDREAKLEELEDDIESARAQFEDASVGFGEAVSYLEELEAERDELTDEIGDLTADRKALENAIEEGKRLLEEGKCPECGQSVEDSPHVELEGEREELDEIESKLEELEAERDDLDERIERAETLREAERRADRLEDNRDNVEQLLAEKRETIVDRRDQRDELRADAEEYENEAAEKREDADALENEIDEKRAELGDINSERTEITETLETLRRVLEITDEREELAGEIENRHERRTDWQEINDERRDRLSDKRERKRDLEEEFDEDRIETAREDRKNAEQYIEKVDARLEELEGNRDEIQGTIGGVEERLEELERLRDRLEELEERCERLESLYDEAETLQTTYGELRSELRQRNVETLERLLNETFDLVYQNDSYAAIELDGDYRLTVYQKDGESLEPEQLSGGERALFNLSLRCAIYRLLAEGVEGTAPMPPLILDEPTVFLDSGHVTQLVSLVESMRELGVEQIVVVSHDEELVGAADSLVRVEKDATSNRSRLERGEPPEMELLASD